MKNFSLSDISIRNPAFAWMLMASLMIFGAICFKRLGISQLPDVDFPVLTISATLEGASPEVVEMTVIEPMESALMTVPGVKGMTSTARAGSGSVTLEFDLAKDIDVAVSEVQTRLAQASRTFPDDMESPAISKSNPEDQPILWLAATTTSSDSRYLMAYVRDVLKNQFTTIPGVGDVFLGGYVEPNLRIWLDPEKMAARNIAVTDVISTIKSEHKEIPAGQIQTPEINYSVRTLGEARDLKEFENFVVSGRGGARVGNPFNIVRIRDIGRVEEGTADVFRLSRFNKMPALGIGIRKQKGTNSVALARKIKAKMVEIQKSLPKDIGLSVNFDSTVFIEHAIFELNRALMVSAFLTAIACWFFLGSWSATFNVLLSIPTSVLGTFIALYFLGFTLNTFTLLALALSIGIIVDDAIMVLENIFRHLEQGKNRALAALVGSREIAFAALAASISIVAIFLPVAFMDGVIGKYFMQFGLTISFAVMISLVEALTITPMRAARFTGNLERTTRLGKSIEWGLKKLKDRYTHSLNWSLSHPWTVIFSALLLTVGSYFLVGKIRKEFTPAQDQSLLLIRMQAQVGASLPYMDQRVRQAEELLLSLPEVKQVYAAVGGFGGGSSETNSAVLFVTLVPPKSRTLTQQQFIPVLREKLKVIEGATSIIQDLSQRGMSSGRGFPVEFTLRGPNWEELAELSKQIIKKMEASGLVADVNSNYREGMPELQVSPRRAALASFGITNESVGKTVSTLIGGTTVGQYSTGGFRYDIRLQVDPGFDRLRQINQLRVPNPTGNLIPLGQLVSAEEKKVLQQITRIDRSRAITISANLAPGQSQQKVMSEIEKLARADLPSGYSVNFGGGSQAFKEAFSSLLFALFLGLVVAYMVLASQFNSFLDPVTILLSMPLSFTGAFLALFAFDQSLNIYSMIGFILLMGIVKKNSILLVEFAHKVRSSNQSLSMREVLVRACPERLRPILMTSFATILGAAPEAFSFGAGGETLRPMGLTVMGGMIFSTGLTLYVVPVVYQIFARFERRSALEAELAQSLKDDQ